MRVDHGPCSNSLWEQLATPVLITYVKDPKFWTNATIILLSKLRNRELFFQGTSALADLEPSLNIVDFLKRHY